MVLKIKEMVKNRIKYSIVSATPTSAYVGMLTQHTGFMLWAFFLSFIFYFIFAFKS